NGADNELIARGALTTNSWQHIAAVLTLSNVSLYLNGMLVTNQTGTNMLPPLAQQSRYYLGACVHRSEPNMGDDFQGSMDEVRIWRTARTPAQIRENIGRRLTGREPGLIGFWNFDDPANPGRDGSPGAHSATFIGQATLTKATLPTLVLGTVKDNAGRRLPGATVEAHQTGYGDRHVTTDEAGEYALTIAPGERCDLFATTGKLSAYRLGFQVSNESQQRLDWTLAETQIGSGAGPVGSGSSPN